MIRAAILGASDYVGGELQRLCAGHIDLRPPHALRALVGLGTMIEPGIELEARG